MSGINRMQMAMLLLACAVAGIGGAGEYLPANFLRRYVAKPAAASLVLFPLFTLAVLKLSAQSYSPFLYFQF
jgi:alginate O-acetyltransferase complex protein AlgI